MCASNFGQGSGKFRDLRRRNVIRRSLVRSSFLISLRSNPLDLSLSSTKNKIGLGFTRPVHYRNVYWYSDALHHWKQKVTTKKETWHKKSLLHSLFTKYIQNWWTYPHLHVINWPYTDGLSHSCFPQAVQLVCWLYQFVLIGLLRLAWLNNDFIMY